MKKGIFQLTTTYGALVLLVVMIVVAAFVAIGLNTRYAGNRRPQILSSAPLSPSMISSLEHQVTCGGCPHAEAGDRLVHDLSIARAINLKLRDLPNGWGQVASPPSPANDKALGILNSAAALRFSSCMNLSAAQRADVMNNADQVLNIGSPVFGLVGPSSSSLSFVRLSSWVDLVATPSQGHRDWEIYNSPRYKSCAPSLWGALLARQTNSKPSTESASSGSISTSPAQPPAQMQFLQVPVVLLVGLVSFGRIDISLVLTTTSTASSLAESSLPVLIRSLLLSMTIRAANAQHG
ncbi:MAG: hypothetical protein ACYDGY_07615 [Acidimicrobiales bacterium]